MVDRTYAFNKHKLKLRSHSREVTVIVDVILKTVVTFGKNFICFISDGGFDDISQNITFAFPEHIVDGPHRL